jgi:amino acid transporter
MPAGKGNQGATGGGKRLGRPRLTTADAVGQALAVGPIQGAGFVLFLIAGTAGAATPLVLVLALVGALCLAWVVSLYARRHAGVGAIYEYVAREHGAAPGIISGSAYFLSALLLTSGAAAAATLLWKGFFAGRLGLDPGFWVTGFVLVALVNGLVYLGVRLSVRVQLALTVVSAIPFVVLIVAVVASGGDSGNSPSVFDPTGRFAGSVFPALLFAVFMFAGFEMAGVLGEEARLPHRSIPRAMLLTIALSGAFFIAVAYAGTIGFGLGRVAQEWGANPVGLSVLGDRYVGSPLGGLIELGVIVDLFAVAVAGSNAIARGVFALARDRLLPSLLSARSRFETPLGGIVVNVSFALAGLLIASGLEDKLALFRTVVVTFSLIVMLVYLVLVLGAIRIIRQQTSRPWSWLVLLMAAALPVLGIYGTLSPFPEGPPRLGIWLTAVLVALTALWATYLRVWNREAFRGAAASAMEPEDIRA